MRWLLALDSATETLALALVPADRAAGTVGRVHQQAGAAQASRELLPALQRLMAEAGCAPTDLDALAVGLGPGAFTGLRTACAVAQGLARGWALPVLGLDDLLIVAEEARAVQGAATEGDWWVAVDARMDELYAGCYAHDGRQGAAGWRVREAPQLSGWAALRARWEAEPPQRVAGNGPEVFGERLGLGPEVGLVRVGAGRAEALGRLAQAAWWTGVPRLAAAEVQPVYLRDKVALTTAERAAGGVLR